MESIVRVYLFSTQTPSDSPSTTYSHPPLAEVASGSSFQQVTGIIIPKYAVLAISIVGVFTNIINIIIFSVRGFKDSMTISLTVLAVWDVVKCGSAFVLMVLEYSPNSSSLLGSRLHVAYFSKFSYVLIIANNVSYLITAYLAIERASYVAHPLKAKLISHPKLTAFVMYALSISSSMYVFVFFFYEIYYRVDPVSNQTHAFCRPTQFYKNHGMEAIHLFRLMRIVTPIASLVIICVSAIVISFLWRASSFRAEAQNEAKITPKMSVREKKMVKMLLVIYIIFILNLVCHIIHHNATTNENAFDQSRRHCGQFSTWSTEELFFDVLNASAHFFIFMTMSSRFKAIFDRLFRSSGRL